jgi:hypothetical protein
VRDHGRGGVAERIVAGLGMAGVGNIYLTFGVNEQLEFVVNDGITEIYGNKA